MYARTVSLPVEVDQQASQAKFENGVLTLVAREEGRRPARPSCRSPESPSGPTEPRPLRPRRAASAAERRRRSPFDVAAMPRCQSHRGGERDHRAVVGAQRQLREVDPGLALFAFAHQPLAQGGVGADAAGDDEPVAARSLRARPATCAPARRRSPPASTPRGRPVPARRSSRACAACVANRRLQPGEREVERRALQQRPRQRVRVGIAELGQPRQRRPAGIAEAEQLGRLVERLAGSVVDRVAEQLVAADVGDAGAVACGRLRPAGRRRGRSAGRPRGTATAGGPRDDGRRRPAVRAPRRASRRHRRRRAARRPARTTRIGDDVDVVAPDVPLAARLAEQRQITRRMWSRDASSGTTPPYAACRSTWLCSSAAASRGRRSPATATSATPVSSQEVSMPSTFMGTPRTAVARLKAAYSAGRWLPREARFLPSAKRVRRPTSGASAQARDVRPLDRAGRVTQPGCPARKAATPPTTPDCSVSSSSSTMAASAS